jgi:hypothetical protein
MVVSARMEGGWPMTLSTAVLRPGDWVHYDGSEHQVLALAGTSVRLRTVDGAESVVLAGHLTASGWGNPGRSLTNDHFSQTSLCRLAGSKSLRND